MTTSSPFETFLPIAPIPCPRPRVAVIRGHGVAYYPAAYKKWQQDFVDLWADRPFPFFDGPVKVDLLIRVEKARTSKLRFPSPDVDNYAKSVLDGLTKIRIWGDDKQVIGLHVFKKFDALPGINLTITSI